MWRDTIDRYIHEGRTVSGGCGASGQQQQIEASQAQFYDQLRSEYGTIFGQDQAVLSALTKSFEPVLQAGPNQEGYSPAEKTALESQATTGVGTNYANAQKALATEQGAQGGGNAYIPSGAKNQQQAQLAESAAQLQSGEQLGITQADYQQGLQNYQFAANELGGVASQLNPTGFANSATGAGNAASTTANEITQANNSWMNLVGGAIGAASSTFGAYEGAQKGCWIAAAVFGGWDDPRTVAVREYLNAEYSQTWHGAIVMRLYLKFGERLAKIRWFVSLVRPLFVMALERASEAD